MALNLRDFLAALGDDLIRVDDEVDPITQAGAVCSASPRPIVLNRLKGFPGWRLCDILVKDRARQAKALGTAPQSVVRELADRMFTRVPGRLQARLRRTVQGSEASRRRRRHHEASDPDPLRGRRRPLPRLRRHDHEGPRYRRAQRGHHSRAGPRAAQDGLLDGRAPQLGAPHEVPGARARRRRWRSRSACIPATRSSPTSAAGTTGTTSSRWARASSARRSSS